MKRIFFYPTRLGKIGVSERDGGITSIYFAQSPRFAEKIEETELIQKTFQEIEEYLEGNRREFTFPMNPIGTEFQKKFGLPYEIFLMEKFVATKKLPRLLAAQKVQGLLGLQIIKIRL